MSDSEASPVDEIMQLVIDGLEELAVTIIEAVRERPTVVAAIVAGVIGAFVGIALAATLGRRKRTPAARASGRLAGVLSALDLEARGKRVSGATEKSASRVGKQIEKGTGGLLRGVGDVRSAADLVPVVVRLAENPLVRGYVAALISRQMRRRFGR